MPTDEKVDILSNGAYHVHVLRFVHAAEFDKQTSWGLHVMGFHQKGAEVRCQR